MVVIGVLLDRKELKMINNLARIDNSFWGTEFNREAKVLTDVVRDIFGHQKSSDTSPNLDIYEKKEGYVAYLDIPGVKKENLDITIEKNHLDISGKVEGIEDLEEAICVNRGRERKKNYSCRIKLSHDVEREKIEANLEHGILKIMLPKAEAVKPKKITIT